MAPFVNSIVFTALKKISGVAQADKQRIEVCSRAALCAAGFPCRQPSWCMRATLQMLLNGFIASYLTGDLDGPAENGDAEMPTVNGQSGVSSVIASNAAGETNHKEEGALAAPASESVVAAEQSAVEFAPTAADVAGGKCGPEMTVRRHPWQSARCRRSGTGCVR